MNTTLESILFADFQNVFNTFENGKNKNGTSPPKEDVGKECHYNDYLQKGEQLMDLARTIYSRKRKDFCLTEAEKCIYAQPFGEKMSMYEILRRISRVFARPCLKQMTSCNDEYAQRLLQMVSCPGIHVSLETEDDVFYHRYVKAGTGKEIASDDVVLKVIVTEEGYEPIRFLGTKNQVHSRQKDMSWVSERCDYLYINVVDMGYLFAALLLYAQVSNSLSELMKMTPEERDGSSLFSAFKDIIDTHVSTFVKRGLKKTVCYNVSVSSVSDLIQYPLTISTMDARDKGMLSVLYDMGASIRLSKNPSWRWGSRTLDDSIGVLDGSDLATCFLLHPGYTFRYHNFIGNRTDISHFFSLPQGYRKNRSSKVMDTLSMETFGKLFCALANERCVQKRTEDYYEALDSATHAKSYQLKKAIPNKVLKAMESSQFNQYFGFVEFDELTDLEKVAEIAMEFRATKETFFKNVDCKDNAIRFRRLGNHKAGGLYYPSVKCLCVDIHSPHSLIHEFGHLIDYSMGRLSSDKAFHRIQTQYEDYLNRKMNTDASFKTLMESGSKFNLSYYTLPTEVFARSFELYVAKVLGVKNSIVRSDFPAAYCTDELFLRDVGEYFNNILQVDAITDVSKEFAGYENGKVAMG